jgi:hypothetical protein
MSFWIRTIYAVTKIGIRKGFGNHIHRIMIAAVGNDLITSNGISVWGSRSVGPISPLLVKIVLNFLENKTWVAYIL